MAHPEFDFTDKSLSAEERLGDLFALNRGFALAVEHLLRRVSAYYELLEEELEGRPAAAEYLALSRKALGQGAGWVKAFREAATADAGAEFETFGMRLLLDGIVKRCRRILPEDRRIDVDLGEEEIVVAGSFFHLQELFITVLLMLLEEERAEGGDLHLRMRVESFSERLLELLRSDCVPGPYLVVSLGWHEAAFDPEAQSAFWDVFAEGVGGDGEADLRFVQIYGIVLEHGGDLFLQQAAAGGYALHIVLPVQAKRKDMQAQHNLEDESLRGSETILLVDDEDMIWDVIIDMLQELGYSVLLAGNGREAVEIYRANPGEIDLVLLDMIMPKLDGHEAFFQLKQIDPSVCVLLTSGYVSEADARDVLAAGAVGFLQKPYRMVELARTIRGIFGGK